MIVGRLCLTEPRELAETGEATLTMSGREAWPTVHCPERADVLAAHEAVLGLRGALVQLQFGRKDERDGYYTIVEASSTLVDVVRAAYIDWSLTLVRHGPDTAVDLESRLTGAARKNDHDASGERWHAPAIGHYAYHTGSTIPSAMTRTGEDGPITVYRGVPAGVSPRWGCAVGDYLAGRVRITTGFPGRELTGTLAVMDPQEWHVSNGLVRVGRFHTSGSIEVASYTGGWKPKIWQIDIGDGPITGWDAVSILRNDLEAATVRLTDSRGPGRVAVDLTVRRGSRFVEVYVQRGNSGSISVYLATPEEMDDEDAYVVATAADADGNQATAGSARNFAPHADGGLTVTSTTTLDCYLGVVAGGGEAVSGDDAEDLLEQYIGALPEVVTAVRR